MSGHSKWSTIKHKKALQDQKRGAIFSKLAKDITIAVREGGSGEADKNPRLRMILQKAREVNMPSDNIKRAISRALSREGGEGMEEAIYEGYGPGGVGIIVRTRTDNRQRTTAEVKNIFESHGGNIGSPGSAMFLFELINGQFKPKNPMRLDSEMSEKIGRFTEELETNEDVEGVFTNLEVG